MNKTVIILFSASLFSCCQSSNNEGNQTLLAVIERQNNQIDSLEARNATLEAQLEEVSKQPNDNNSSRYSDRQYQTNTLDDGSDFDIMIREESWFSLLLGTCIPPRKNNYIFGIVRIKLNGTPHDYITNIRTIGKFDEEVYYKYLDELRSEVRYKYPRCNIETSDVFLSNNYKAASLKHNEVSSN